MRRRVLLVPESSGRLPAQIAGALPTPLLSAPSLGPRGKEHESCAQAYHPAVRLRQTISSSLTLLHVGSFVALAILLLVACGPTLNRVSQVGTPHPEHRFLGAVARGTVEDVTWEVLASECTHGLCLDVVLSASPPVISEHCGLLPARGAVVDARAVALASLRAGIVFGVVDADVDQVRVVVGDAVSRLSLTALVAAPGVRFFAGLTPVPQASVEVIAFDDRGAEIAASLVAVLAG